MSSSLIDRIIMTDQLPDLRGDEEASLTPPHAHVLPVDQAWYGAREGELAVDVYQTDNAIVIKAAIAGVRREDIAIEIQNDMVTIRGVRYAHEEVSEERYLYRECYWGPFSRTIVLPTEVRTDEARATFQNSILKLILPTIQRPQRTIIPVTEQAYE